MINLSDRTWRGLSNRTWRGLGEAVGLPSALGALTLFLLFLGRLYAGIP